MGALAQLLERAAAVRRRLRFRLWALRSRTALARVGCTLEIVAPRGASFGTPPVIEPTRQGIGHVDTSSRGSLRIELGEWVHLGRNVTIEVLPSAHSVLALGDGVVLGTAVRLMTFGGELRVGAWSRLRDGVTMKSSGRLRIGEHGIFQSYTMIHCAEEVLIESRASFAERITVIDSDHLVDGSNTHSQARPIAVDAIHIGENAFIAANAVLLRGVRLGRNSVVAAGSVVRAGEYPSGWLVAGAPAEAKKALPAADRAGETAA